jgi:cytochrome c oxidase cbb3-type subunit 4
MDKALFHSIWTVLLFITFVGIVFWAWSGKRKDAFREAAHLPLEDEEYVTTASTSGD